MVFYLYTALVIFFSFPLYAFSTRQDNHLKNIVSLTAGKNGVVYLSNISDRRIDMYSDSGEILGNSSYIPGFSPGDLCYSNALYVANTIRPEVITFSDDCQLKSRINLSRLKGKDIKITALYVNEYIFVGDSVSAAILKYDLQGNFMMRIGGVREPYFENPASIVVKDNLIYAADFKTGAVYCFNKFGKLLFTADKPCVTADSIAVSDYFIAVSDWSANIINIYSLSLQFVRSIKSDFLNPSGIALYQNYILVNDSMNAMVKKTDVSDLFSEFSSVPALTNLRSIDLIDNKRKNSAEQNLQHAVDSLEKRNLDLSSTYTVPRKEFEKQPVSKEIVEKNLLLKMFSSTPEILKNPYLIILLDCSASMDKKLPAVQNALTQLIQKLPQNSIVRIIEFSEEIRDHKGFRPDKALQTIQTLTAGGTTYIWDALYYVKNLIHGDEDNVLCLLITDGAEGEEYMNTPGSLQTFANIKELFSVTRIHLCTVFLTGTADDTVLKELSGITGGTYYETPPEKPFDFSL